MPFGNSKIERNKLRNDCISLGFQTSKNFKEENIFSSYDDDDYNHPPQKGILNK